MRHPLRCRSARALIGALLVAAGALPGRASGSGELALGGEPGRAITWLTNLEQAVEQAEILRRPVMLDLWAKWCRWCHELDRRTYADPRVVERAETMTCGKIDMDREPGVGLSYRIRGLPTILFLDRHGQEIDRVNGFVEAVPFARLMDDVLLAADRSAALAEELRRDPDNPARLWALADELIAQGRLEEAEPLLAPLTPAGPLAGSGVEPAAVLDLAVVRAGRGDAEAARAVLEGFLEAYPRSPRRAEAELRLGQLLLAAGEIERARDHLDEVIGLARGSWKEAEARRLDAIAKRMERERAE